jgi:hypothetical protein
MLPELYFGNAFLRAYPIESSLSHLYELFALVINQFGKAFRLRFLFL